MDDSPEKDKNRRDEQKVFQQLGTLSGKRSKQKVSNEKARHQDRREYDRVSPQSQRFSLDAPLQKHPEDAPMVSDIRT